MENIPKENGFLLYGNHQGLFDVLAIAATCDNPLGAVLKKELAKIPFLKQIIACTHSFAMDREDIKQSMEVIVNVIKEVKNGRNYLIFPEGTRSRLGNKLLEFHGGSFKCAIKAKCPVVPIAFIDSFKVLDQKGCKPVSVQIHYLEPIFYEEYKDGKIIFNINLRIPVTYNLDEILNKYRFFDNEVTLLSTQDPLYIEKDSYLVKTLVDIFNKKTNTDSKPITIGGGTYARAFENFISYGLTMPGEKDMCHQVDEFVKIDDLILGSKIYAEAIYNLAK